LGTIDFAKCEVVLLRTCGSPGFRAKAVISDPRQNAGVPFFAKISAEPIVLLDDPLLSVSSHFVYRLPMVCC
jgi:hypothetical protein